VSRQLASIEHLSYFLWLHFYYCRGRRPRADGHTPTKQESKHCPPVDIALMLPLLAYLYQDLLPHAYAPVKDYGSECAANVIIRAQFLLTTVLLCLGVRPKELCDLPLFEGHDGLPAFYIIVPEVVDEDGIHTMTGKMLVS
jgi:hypothetical protein